MKGLLKTTAQKPTDILNDSACRHANNIFANQYGISGLLEGLITPNYRSKIVCLFVCLTFGCRLVRRVFFFHVVRRSNAASQKRKLRLELDLFAGDSFLCGFFFFFFNLMSRKQFECFVYRDKTCGTFVFVEEKFTLKVSVRE